MGPKYAGPLEKKLKERKSIFEGRIHMNVYLLFLINLFIRSYVTLLIIVMMITLTFKSLSDPIAQ